MGLLLALTLAVVSTTSRTSVTGLRCEYLVNPINIDDPSPRLSWIVEDSGRAWFQSAYQIIVASRKELLNENKGDLWDTGQVHSGETTQIAYLGKPIAARQECF
jgi:alpha-L-rhamnosidase